MSQFLMVFVVVDANVLGVVLTRDVNQECCVNQCIIQTKETISQLSDLKSCQTRSIVSQQ